MPPPGDSDHGYIRGGRHKRGIPSTLRFRSCLHNTVYDVMRERGWVETESDSDWDFCWADKEWIREFFDGMQWSEHQRVNHFRNHYELTRKDLLVKNLKRARRALEREGKPDEAKKYDVCPTSFVLPADYGMFCEEFKRSPGIPWIMKPIGKAQGRGIFLFTRLSQISDWKKDHRWRADTPQAEAYIVQRYVPNPYLIGGRKFDLRLYCLVTSFSPLTVYLYRAGFARFSNHRFSMDNKDITNNFVHLTNVAIQKTAVGYDKNNGCKWWLDNLRVYMTSRHGHAAINEMFAEMQSVILHSLFSVAKGIINDKHSFELYGYDILIDDNLKPWLLEVNASPSLSAENAEDYALKHGMLEDMLNVLDIERRFPPNETEIGGFDLVYRGGPIPSTTGYSSYIGCHNPREKVNAKLMKKAEKLKQSNASGSHSNSSSGRHK